MYLRIYSGLWCCQRIYSGLWCCQRIYSGLWCCQRIYSGLWCCQRIYSGLWCCQRIYSGLWCCLRIYSGLCYCQLALFLFVWALSLFLTSFFSVYSKRGTYPQSYLFILVVIMSVFKLIWLLIFGWTL
uniref:Uncharacterized protein n=1 Tax=Cacopsylla melanoneura TaxID=428564 RepID=A0A8D8VTX1_9HEMI